MTALEQVAASWMLNVIWQPAAVYFTALLAMKLFRLNAATRYRVWLAACLTACICPFGAVLGLWSEAAPKATVLQPDVPENILRACLIVMMFGVLLRGVALLRSLQRTQSTIGNARRVCLLSHRRAQVRIAASSGPFTAGFFRPVIVLPESLLEKNREPVLSAAMAHESAHIARHDTRWAVITEVLLCFLAFHPGARLFRRRLAEWREIACDAHVLAGSYPQREYANALLAMARLSLAHQTGIGLGAGSMLSRRIEELLNYRARRTAPLCEAVIAAVAVILAIGLADTARVTLGEIHPIPELPSIQLYKMLPAPPPPPPPPRP